ncbi:MAG: hypothetical protein R6V10_06125 [bacterium]
MGNKSIISVSVLCVLLFFLVPGCDNEKSPAKEAVPEKSAVKKAAEVPSQVDDQKQATDTSEKAEDQEQTEAGSEDHPETSKTSADDPVKPTVKVEPGESFEVELKEKKQSTYYKAEVPGKGYLQASCREVPEDITLAYRFVDEEGKELQDTEKSNAIRVREGTYYTAVYERWGKESPSDIPCKLVYTKEMDPHEPNNTVQNAKKVSLDEELSFAIYPRGDKDYFKVEVPEAGYLNVVVTEPVKDLTYNYRFVRKTEGDIFKGGEIQDTEKSNAVRVSKGTYIIGVRDRYNKKPSDFQEGKLKFVFVPEMDPHEPNDTIENAAEVPLDEEIPFAIYPRGDKDYFQVEVPEAGYLNAVVTEPAEDLTYNYRFVRKSEEDIFKAGKGEEIQDTEKSNAVRVSKGTYIIGVRDRWNNKPSSFQEGKLKFVFMPEMDPHEPNDTVKNAKKVPLDEEISFAIYPRGDKDYFKVEVPEAGYLNAVVTEPAEDLTYNYRFLGEPEGESVKGEMKELQDTEKSNAIRVTKGTYIIGVRDRWNNKPSSFQKGKLKFVFVPEVDPHEPNDTVKNAAKVPLDEELSFAIYPRGDKDYFKVKVEDKGKLKVVITEPAEDLTYNYFFGDASGSELQSTEKKNSLEVEEGTYIIGLWDRWKNNPQSLQKGKAKIVLEKE